MPEDIRNTHQDTVIATCSPNERPTGQPPDFWIGRSFSPAGGPQEFNYYWLKPTGTHWDSYHHSGCASFSLRV